MSINSSYTWRRFALFAGPFILTAILVAGLVPEYRNLALLFLFTIASNNVIPMPYEPVMVVMGALYAPLLAATVAACGNVIACFIDYKAIRYAFQHKSLQKIQNTDMYQGAVHYFLKAPFVCVLIAAFAPFIPFYIFRVLSPTSDYPLRRYMAAVFLGRWPRYFLFAFLGSALLPARLLIICALLFLACIGLYLLVRHHLVARGRMVSAPFESTPFEVVE
ncbi:MAG: VTT domain-containing protein [Candidatus Latescibacterota bacterium]